MTLDYSYSFSIEFDLPVFAHSFALMTKPNGTGQKIEHFETDLSNFNTVIDGFGNELMFGCVYEPHKEFVFNSTGSVRTQIDTPSTRLPASVFLQSTKLVPFCEALSVYDDSLNLKNKLPMQKANYLCSFIFNNFTYERGYTHSKSDITDVIKHGKGVCQDFAHLMLSIMRLEGVPSRYVSGLVDGEGESHAWVECLIDDRWIGFDPTHECQTFDKPYLKFAVGRDYDDVAPNSGVFKGVSMYQKLQVSSKVTRVD